MGGRSGERTRVAAGDTRGAFPSPLVRGGLGPALTSYLGRGGGPGQVAMHSAAAGRRFDPQVEAARYFCVTEAAASLQTPIAVDVAEFGGELALHVRGRAQGDLSMAHMRDRVEAAGGTALHAAAGDDALLYVRLPAAAR